MLRISISHNYYPCLKESFTPHFAVEEVLPWRVGPANSRCTKEEEETSSTLLNGNSFSWSSNFGCTEHPVRSLTCFGFCSNFCVGIKISRIAMVYTFTNHNKQLQRHPIIAKQPNAQSGTIAQGHGPIMVPDLPQQHCPMAPLDPDAFSGP